jgi:HSP20 family protein
MSTMTARPENTAAATPIQYVVPDVNIYEDSDGYVLEAEMPGVNKAGLDVTLEGNELVIAGRRAGTAATGDALYRESRGLDFRRTFELDPAIDGSRISAGIDQGVLTLKLPKAESVKPRRIEIDG